jgi:hypothetical protein
MLASAREQWTANQCKLWGNLCGPGFAANFKRADHLTTSNAVWLAKDAIKTGTMGSEKAVATVRDYITVFLDENLRDQQVHPLLTGPSLEHPDDGVTTQEHPCVVNR